METWPRRQHYEFFSTYGQPHFGLCADVDVTSFYPAVKQRRHSLTIAIVYVIARASNAVPAFRYRIRGKDVIEHETVSPGFTILVDKEVFSFCIVDYTEDFGQFAAEAAAEITAVRADPWVSRPPRDDVLYTTAIPWVSFTTILHPMPDPPDSVPRYAWGKIFAENERLKMPLAVQGHHALMDGIHMGQVYDQVQAILDQPEEMFGTP
jgi:chloramphenicol O-acetyltransferase type A